MASPVLLASGSVFASQFVVERPLAEGGMGAVYVVEQISTQKRRALKVMHPNLVPDLKSRRRFVEEARIGGRILSEHVVEVLSAGVDEDSGMPWLLMELLEGEDLEQLVVARGPLSPLAAKALLEQVGHALTAAHSIGVIHRDLKPENIFVAVSHRVSSPQIAKVLDFGIARVIDGNRSSATVTSAIGSPLWMAPEQATPGAQLTPSTDVWALGLIAYYLLTGQPYWLAANAEPFSLPALLVESMTHPIAPPSQRALGLPPGFDAWFMRCVAREPAERFADAREALEGLDQAFDGGDYAGETLAQARIVSSRPLAFAPTAADSPEARAMAREPHEPAPVAAPVAPRGPSASAIGAGLIGLLVVFGLVVIAGGAVLLHYNPTLTQTPPVGTPVAPAPVAPTPVTPTPTAPTPTAPTPPVPPPPVAPAPSGQGLDADAINRVVRSHSSEVRRCYESALRLDPELGGRVTLGIRIGPEGEVEHAEVEQSTLGNRGVEECLRESALRWRFPAPADAQPVSVRFPLVLRSQ